VTTPPTTDPDSISVATTATIQFALDFLPPYSPELNPVEGVWKLTPSLCLHDRYIAFLMVSPKQSKANSANWLDRTKPSVVYAQKFKTPCLNWE
jgi:DDE superfamily endonuclease